MDCKRCKLFTKTEVLERNNGFCSFCAKKKFYCRECKNEVDFENFNETHHLCLECIVSYNKCSRCDEYSRNDFLNTHEKLCERCHERYCRCTNCEGEITYQNSQSMHNLCIQCNDKYQKLLYKKDQIKNTIGFLNKIFISTLFISLSIIFLKVTGKTEVKWLDLAFNLGNIWIIYLALTIAHLYLSSLLISSIREVFDFRSYELYHEIFHGVVSSDSLFFNGFIPKYSMPQKFSRRIFVKRDINFALQLTTLLLVIPATFDKQNSFFSLFIGLSFAVLNWFIGSLWAIKLSYLKSEYC